ncbi:MAG TPA: hypothetical protein VHG70_07005 [Nocardioidaceae bacterium]|nr:hypothetical protein [Nocardioidaceae bacterium]
MPALRPALDLGSALRDAVRLGAGFVPAAVEETFREQLLAEVDDGPFEALPERAGAKEVRQQADIFVVRGDMRTYPHARELREELVSRLREQGGPLVDAWRPNNAAVQRYAPGSLGVTPHLDGRRFRYLVAVFTLGGVAPFALCSDRSGTVLRQWVTRPGSLVLMRAPGLAGLVDGRPLHTVRGPRNGPRTSFTFRMDSRASRCSA